jgi:hypothetical protein
MRRLRPSPPPPPPLGAANRDVFLAPPVMDEAAVRAAHFERLFQRGADFWSGRRETKQVS